MICRSSRCLFSLFSDMALHWSTRWRLWAFCLLSLLVPSPLVLLGRQLTFVFLGAALPLITVIMGNMTNLFGSFTSPDTPSLTPVTVDYFNSKVRHSWRFKRG